MSHINIEIKARCTQEQQEAIRELLESQYTDFRGRDHQVDTYFNVPHGRLKLREGTIENCLIHYERENQPDAKQSKVTLYQPHPPSTLKELLTKALGILVVVDKHREIYFIDNVKFHLDDVAGLGTFMEIEAIDNNGSHDRAKLLQQCKFYKRLFGIQEQDLISLSYSDLLIQAKELS